jgi:predicted Zn-dependent protease
MIKSNTYFRPLKTLASLILAFALLFGCSTVPHTERSQLMMVSQAQEVRLGTEAFASIKSKSKLNKNERLNALIRRVGLRIAKATDTENLDWEFIIIDEDQVNAFALPGGKVAFYAGILPLCEDEAGVATVRSAYRSRAW